MTDPVSAYAFDYPEALVAARPATPRDSARLMVLGRRRRAAPEDRTVADLPELLCPGDCLVVNRTKVWPARLVGRKATGGRAEILLLREVAPGLWSALGQGLRPGARLDLGGGDGALVESAGPDGERVLRFDDPDVRGLMDRRGLPPLPPYILRRRREAPARPRGPGRAAAVNGFDDSASYQTVYAKDEGSVAAPTAGLHFTGALLGRLRRSGVAVAEITLHVGHGTFEPITVADAALHRMKPEWYRIPPEAASAMARARAAGGRVVAVGTTATRALESAALTGSAEGWADLFIRPGHRFRAVDALLTNFHLPRSTPLMLACAFAGRGRLLAAYREAVARGYRLYSYGDAMLIL